MVTDSTTSEVTEASTGNGLNPGQSHTLRTWHWALYERFHELVLRASGHDATDPESCDVRGRRATPAPSTRAGTAPSHPTQTVLQPGDSQWQVTTALGYDSFGNVNSQTVTGVGMTARTTGVNWGSTGQFPVSITNALSQTTQKGWDYALRHAGERPDPNGIATSWQYDAFGRRNPREPPGRHLLDLDALPVHRVRRALATAGTTTLPRRSVQLRQCRRVYQLVDHVHDPLDRMVDRTSLNRDGYQVNEHSTSMRSGGCSLRARPRRGSMRATASSTLPSATTSQTA